MPRSKHPFQITTPSTIFRIVPVLEKKEEVTAHEMPLLDEITTGLDSLVGELSELIVYPILYHKLLRRINICTPRGILTLCLRL